ncbi:unnamed protein product [Medioppia subpectinata]|uniref:Glutathione S-transferase n=1 Tax=Medioppia subpectinata TaxID=1979941 RepID=A0A7R9KL07_9ACAR|nr:unnamed protein product [Medioppia subpectinata]CAG2105553.1 unnamed protein product [Medioppia subpectinata]
MATTRFFLLTYNRTIAMELSGLTWQENREIRHTLGALQSHDQLIKHIKENNHDEKYPLVMDIGCGPGNIAKVLAKELNPDHIVGLDIDPNVIAFAKQHNAMANTDYYIQDISQEWNQWDKSLQKLAGKVSVIFSNFTLHWFLTDSTGNEDIDNILRELIIKYFETQNIVKQLPNDKNLLEIEGRSKGQQLSPDFIKVNPVHTVPTIDDNGFILWESRAIMQYLCNQYAPDSTLYPKDPLKRALVDRYLNFDVILSSSQREFPKLFFSVDVSENKVKVSDNYLKILDQLIGDNKYLVGDELTIADLSLLSGTPSRAVHLTVRELNIDVNIHYLDLTEGEQMTPQFQKLNPNRKVPTIDDNGFALWESRAIMQYLCNQYAPDSTLYPKDPKKRAIVDRFLNFDLSFFANHREVVVMAKTLRGVDPPEDKQLALKNELKLLNSLIGDHKYLTGEVLTIADLSLSSIVANFYWFDYELSEYTNIERWYSTLQKELPYFSQINDIPKEETQLFLNKVMQWMAKKSDK